MLDESSKANYQPWRQEEFNADIRVRKMTVVQRWMYKTLLQEAWVCSTRPHLPDRDDDLWMLADCESPEQWEENKATVRRMFEKVQIDGVSLLVHKRINTDWKEFTKGWVYFVQGDNTRRIKIGYTEKDPRIRLGQLQVGSPDRLVLLGVIKGNEGVERYTQATWRHLHAHGEWFEESPELSAFINEYVLPQEHP